MFRPGNFREVGQCEGSLAVGTINISQPIGRPIHSGAEPRYNPSLIGKDIPKASPLQYHIIPREKISVKIHPEDISN